MAVQLARLTQYARSVGDWTCFGSNYTLAATLTSFKGKHYQLANSSKLTSIFFYFVFVTSIYSHYKSRVDVIVIYDLTYSLCIITSVELAILQLELKSTAFITGIKLSCGDERTQTSFVYYICVLFVIILPTKIISGKVSEEVCN